MPNEIQREWLDRALSDGEYPKKGDNEAIAKLAYDLWQHSLDNMRSHHIEIAKCRRYYRGRQMRVILEGDQTTYENEVQSTIETMVPIISSNVARTALMPQREEQAKAVEALDQRTEHALRKSGFHRKSVIEHLVKNMVQDGSVVIGGMWNGTLDVFEPWRLLPIGRHLDPTKEEYIEQMLVTKADLVAYYGNVFKKISAEYETVGGEELNPIGAPSVSNEDVRTNPVTLTVDGGDPVTIRPSISLYDTTLDRAKKILLLRLSLRDKSTNKDGMPVYPYGRMIDVALGLQDGDKYDGEAVVLKDRGNRFAKYFKATGRFPYIRIDYHDINDIWGGSAITPLIPMQDSLNAMWVRFLQNMAEITAPQRIISPRAGLKEGDLSRSMRDDIYLKVHMNPEEAIYYVKIPDILSPIIAGMAQVKNAIRDQSGVLDVTRGEKPGAVTAASAIGILQQKADSRLLAKAEHVTDGLALAREMLAYICQEIDEMNGMTQFPDWSSKERKYIDYDPAMTSNAQFMVEGTVKKQLSELIPLLSTAADLQQKGISPKLLFLGTDDPTLLHYYQQVEAEQAEAQRVAAEQQKAVIEAQSEADAKKQRSQIAADLTKEAMSNARSNGSKEETANKKASSEKAGE